jgi:hypothetical protein
MNKYGLILEPYKPEDYYFQGVTGIDDEILEEDGDWSEYLPIEECQRGYYVETQACVSFSALNVLETLFKRKFHKEVNFSDRFLAKVSGTTKNGNTFTNVAEAIRKYGLVYEEDWSWNRATFTWDEFYLMPDTQVFQKANEWRQNYEVKYEWVIPLPEKLMDALKYAPLQIGVYAWDKKEGDIYLRTEKPQNHAVVLFGYEKGKYWKIFDTYSNYIKFLAWNFSFTGAIKFSLNLKKPMTAKFENNTLLQEVEETGMFALYLDNKLYVDSLDKLLATWLMRNNGKVEGKCKAVKKQDIEGLKKYNLKNELIL